MREQADVVVIGAGVIGAAVAFELAKKGYATLNVDRLPAAGYGPTSNSCAIVRAHYSSEQGVAMAYENFGYWERWAEYLDADDELGHAKYLQCGTVLLKAPDGHWQKSVAHFEALGVEHEQWSLDTLAERLPYISLGSFYPPRSPHDPEFNAEPERQLEGAVYTSRSGYVSDPQLTTHNLQRAAEAKGGRFRYGVSVVSVDSDSSRVTGVTLDDGTQIEAPVVINVAGPQSFVINRMAGVEDEMNIKTRALRHEVHHVPAPPGVDFGREGFHVSDQDLGTYFRPEVGNHILVGSEDPACDERTWVEDAETWDRGVTQAQWEAQVYRLARRIPTLPIPNERRGVVDLYDVSDDWIPIYDKSALPGFYMAVGTSGNQFKNAPVVGELMAAIVDGCENGRDHDADPISITGQFTGLKIDGGFYSRNREINRNSSFSVNG